MLLTASNKVRDIEGTLSRLSPKRVHVTFGESKRVLFLKRIKSESCVNFLHAFSDSLSDDIPLSNVRFQQYDHTFKKYVNVENEMKLENNAKMKAFITLCAL